MTAGRKIILALAAMMLMNFGAGHLTAAGAAGGSCGDMKGEILEYGIARGVVEKAPKSADTSAGTAAGGSPTMTKIQFLETTERIPLRDGVIMLLKYRLSNLPAGIPVIIREEKTHPATQNPDGRSVDHVLIRQMKARFRGESFIDSAFLRFSDKYPSEMIPGAWQILVRVNDCTLVAKSFLAYRP